MKVGVFRETDPGERRVALVPETVKKLSSRKLETIIETDAGQRAGFPNEEYVAAGAKVGTRQEVLTADTFLTVAPPSPALLSELRPQTALVGLCYPMAKPELVRAAMEKQLLLIALDLIPRISLAQAMDVLSSQANLAGYWAVVAAASRLPKIFPLLMTAAGTITPARVLVMGVGVAGLQAIGTARRLGAVVEATDVRPETKEQVESLGGRFLSVEGVEYKKGQGGYAAEQSDEYKQKQAELVSQAIARSDVVITTALIPGRRAPRLVTAAQVQSMRHGSVIVDLAAEQGGNVEGCPPDGEIETHGVTIIGPASAASHVAYHASQALSRNIEKLLAHLTADGAWKIDRADEITAGCVVTHNGELVHERVRQALETKTAAVGS